jgi:hypothetical protein
MEPIERNDRQAPRPTNDYDEHDEHDQDQDSRRSAPEKEKPTPGEMLKKNWMAVAGLLVVVLIGGLFLWLKSAKEAAQRDTEPVAAASANIEPNIASVEQAPPVATASPVAQAEAQRRAELDAANTPARASTDEVAEVFAVDTTGQALRRKRRVAAAQAVARRQAEADRIAAADVDTVETTVQDPATGSYRAQQMIVPRRPRSGGSGARRASNAPRTRSLLPSVDADGTPFETDPDVLAMLSTSPPETRASYERMTGKRYRDPAVAAQQLANRVNAPGMDGFNTVKVGNSSRMMAQGNGQPLAPDVFFQCVINGEQKVRSGSVVILRLMEDAVISGVTFPKNMVFAAVANVGTNSVELAITRLGPTRVDAQIYDFNYMPGIMIDPAKKIAKDAQQAGNDLQTQTTRELSTAIDRSASAANSVTGVAGRIGATMLSRPRTRTKLRDVLLPDGYPILITSSAAGQAGPSASVGGR